MLYVAISVHCFVRTAAISRELDSAQRVFALVSRGAPGFRVVGPDVVTADGTRLPPGQVTTHIRNLILKAGCRATTGSIRPCCCAGSPTRCAGPNQLGSFASDALMKLGLLGTIIGFILMLAPIAGLDAADRASVKSSMGLMSDGMAVAMYTTLTGLIGSVLLQTQYYMLDEATAKLFGLATDLTEVFVVLRRSSGSSASLQ